MSSYLEKFKEKYSHVQCQDCRMYWAVGIPVVECGCKAKWVYGPYVYVSQEKQWKPVIGLTPEHFHTIVQLEKLLRSQ